MTLGGPTKRSVEDRGGKSEPRGTGDRSKERKRRRKTGHGEEVSHRILWVEVAGGKKAFCQSADGSRRSTKEGQVGECHFQNHVATDGSLLGVSSRWSVWVVSGAA